MNSLDSHGPGEFHSLPLELNCRCVRTFISLLFEKREIAFKLEISLLCCHGISYFLLIPIYYLKKVLDVLSDFFNLFKALLPRSKEEQTTSNLTYLLRYFPFVLMNTPDWSFRHSLSLSCPSIPFAPVIRPYLAIVLWVWVNCDNGGRKGRVLLFGRSCSLAVFGWLSSFLVFSHFVWPMRDCGRRRLVIALGEIGQSSGRIAVCLSFVLILINLLLARSLSSRPAFWLHEIGIAKYRG